MTGAVVRGLLAADCSAFAVVVETVVSFSVADLRVVVVLFGFVVV